MGFFKDEYGLQDWAIIALPIAGILLFMAIAIPAALIGSVHVVHVDCLRLHEATGRPTKVVASGVDRDCYIQLGNGAWIPADRYRGVEVDD